MLLYRARAGVTGLVAALADLGMELVEVPNSVLVGTKYVVGPVSSGAQYQTIGAAIAAVVADAPAGTPLISVHPGTYTENVVVPNTLTSLVIYGVAGGPVLSGGPIINGTLTWNMSASATLASLVGMTVNSAVVFSHPGSVSRPVIRLDGCYLPTTSAITINSVASVQGANVRINNTFARVAINGTAYSLLMVGGAWHEGGTFTTHLNGRLTGVDMKGSFSTVVWNLTSNTSSWSVESQCSIWGRLSFTGVGFNFRECYIDYPGGPAVTSNCTGSVFMQNNSFAHNAGGSPFAYIQNGPSLLHEGGNTFLEGADYPWFQLNAGSRNDRAESDTEQRRVTSMAGSPILTPAEVGSQRKTTIAKVNGGGVVTLPLAANVEPGCTIVVKDLNGSATASPFTVAPQGVDLIDGGVVPSISTDYGAITFQQMSTTDWGIIGRYL